MKALLRKNGHLVAFFFERIKPVLMEKYEFENRNVLTLTAFIYFFRQSGLRNKYQDQGFFKVNLLLEGKTLH